MPGGMNYDVKIIAGRRVVIYKDDKDGGQAEKPPQQIARSKSLEFSNPTEDPRGGQFYSQNPDTSLDRYQSSSQPTSSNHQDSYVTRDQKTRTEYGNSNMKTSAQGLDPDPGALLARSRVETANKFTQTELDQQSQQPPRAPSPKKKATSFPPWPTDEPESPDHPLNETFTFKGMKKSSGFSSTLANQRKEFDAKVVEIMADVPERNLDKMLIEMRTKDRDRDRVVRPDQMKSMVDKYNIQVQDVIEDLNTKFNDKSFPGNVNYEDLVQYLKNMRDRSSSSKSDFASQPPQVEQHSFPKRTSNNYRRSVETPPKRTSPSFSFNDRDDAKLILELEKTLMESPKFNLNKFQSDLISKDYYGNGQVSRQHVIQAAENANLNISKNTLGMLMATCDPTNKRIYHISKLVKYLERSQPHLLEMRSSSSKRL